MIYEVKNYNFWGRLINYQLLGKTKKEKREGIIFEEREINNKRKIVTNGIDVNPNISIMI